MCQVHVIAWKAGRQVLPISFAKIVRKHLNCDLQLAKEALDALSDHGEAFVTFDSQAAASAFADEVREIGAICVLRDED